MAITSALDATPADYAQLLIMAQFPESTVKESRVIKEWLIQHAKDYDKLQFRVRLGTRAQIDPSLPLALQKQAAFAQKKKADLLAWNGRQPTIVEFKYLVTPSALGQIQSYRVFFLEEQPDALDPILVVAGAACDADTLHALQEHNITVLLYPAALVSPNATGGGV